MKGAIAARATARVRSAMPISAHGIDLVEVARVQRVLSDHPERFLERCFTAREVADADASGPARRGEVLAGRFAAKEAVFKALGTGLSGGMSWTDVEVVRRESGQPEVRLSGRAARRAEELGISSWVVSISHTGGAPAGLALAVASVIGLDVGG